MCTVVASRTAQGAVLLLALRDERVGRPFDEPGAWWPDQPDVVGGRDRQAGGTWCATDVATGTTALVLNRPQRREALPGAVSRGVLPLRALAAGDDWPQTVDVAPMASFALLLAGPAGLRLWVWDGSALTADAPGEGTVVVTSGGPEDGKAARHLPALQDRPSAARWRALVAATEVEDDPTALLVRHEHPGGVWATVFGQVLEAVPGTLSLSWSRTPQTAASWVERTVSRA